MKSHLNGVAWPAIPSPRSAQLQALLFQLERTQWWPAEKLMETQLLQVEGLLRHAYDSASFHRVRLDASGYRPGAPLAPEFWRGLPLLTRRDIQEGGRALMSAAVPPQHGGIHRIQTSGSSGEPLEVSITGVNQLMWEVNTLREHLWHRRDFSGKLAAIRANAGPAGAPPDGSLLPDWGPPVNLLFDTGPAALLGFADIATQAAWLLRHRPDFLLTYPNNLEALIAHFSGNGGGAPPGLRAVRTIGETVKPELRAACRETWGVALVDSYSSQELGYIAVQCPDSDLYHVMAESVMVEILAEDGRPCRPGELGRVVVTSLHNFAMPLIRYELADYAEAGGPCPCGRGLPTIARIVGRSRNLVTLPGGERCWPLVGFQQYREIAPVRQYQLVQHSLDEIEVRLVTDRPLTADEEIRLTAVIRDSLGHPFRLRFTYFSERIPRGAGGKFEEFMSLLAL